MLVGGVVNGIFSLFIRWSFFQPYVANGQWGEFFAGLLWMVFLGFTMSVIAQAGFFAYLTLHQVGVNIFRTLTLWNWVQLLLIAVTIFDIVFFRFVPGVKDGQSWVFYMGLLVVLIFASVATAMQKVKMTGKNMF